VKNSGADDWAGYAVADALDIDLDDPAEKERVKKCSNSGSKTKSSNPNRARTRNGPHAIARQSSSARGCRHASFETACPKLAENWRQLVPLASFTYF
jgi:hypothetical protein